MNLLQLLISNPVSWLILLLALGVYAILLYLLFDRTHQNDARRQEWLHTLPTLLTALPLLGLLGTIVGLLQTFARMARGSMDIQQLLSSGIGDALITTQLGLLMVIPGLILLALLRRKARSLDGDYAQ